MSRVSWTTVLRLFIKINNKEDAAAVVSHQYFVTDNGAAQIAVADELRVVHGCGLGWVGYVCLWVGLGRGL